jgi:hypothetical protein
MKFRIYIACFLLLLFGSSQTLAQGLRAWQSQGWCDYSWPPGEDPPPRLNLPEWVCQSAFEAKLHAKYSPDTKVNPFFLGADLDGDGRLEVAVWITETRTKKRGLVIFHQSKTRPFILAAGTKWDDRGDDFLYLDKWSLIPRGEKLESPHEEGRKVLLKGDALVLAKSESAAFAVYWSGGRYKSYQLSD